jgi:hypothetical protein
MSKMQIFCALLTLLTMIGCAKLEERDFMCSVTSDCPRGRYCHMASCIPLPDDVSCPMGQSLIDGRCTLNPQCVSDADCTDRLCVDGECLDHECSPGEERFCAGSCITIQQCWDGLWSTCPQPVVGDTDDGCSMNPDLGVTSADNGVTDASVLHDGAIQPTEDAQVIEDALSPIEDALSPIEDALTPIEDAQVIEDEGVDLGPPLDASVSSPINDLCEDGAHLTPVGTQHVEGDTRGANTEHGRTSDVWYTFTLQTATTVDALLEGVDEWDTYLYLLKDDCDQLNEVAFNDDFEGVGQSRIYEEALTPGTYHLVVSGYNERERGAFDLTVTFSDPSNVPNDLCADAIMIPRTGSQRREGDTTEAQQDFGPMARGNDLWYRFSIDVTTDVTILLEGEDDWDTYLYLLSGRCDQLEEIDLNDDFNGIGQSKIEALSLAPDEYFIVVSAFSDRHFGPFELNVDFEPTRYYDESIFLATHNSYSGDERNSLIDQLNLGVRLFELDIHDNLFGTFNDFRVGHDSPGDEVLFGNGNPNTDLLNEWLNVIKEWSDSHSSHSPITIVLDIKDNLTDNRSFDEGNLGRLNAALTDTFQSDLFRADEMGARGSEWPSIGALRGKVITVLSGREQDRRAYRSDEGHNPAVALNNRRQVVEVHDDGRDDLWYWTGLLNIDTDEVRWIGHARYDSGRFPAVAMNEQGVVVEVHRSDDALSLWYRVGQFRADGTGVDFGDSHRFDSGILPSIRFIDQNTIREVHQSQNNSQRWFHTGVVDPVTKTIQWGEHDSTTDPFYVRDQSTTQILGTDHSIRVRSRANDDHLHYTVNSSGEEPIRYEKIAFIDIMYGDEDLIDEYSHFFSAEASDDDAIPFVDQWRNLGGIIRLWSYNQVLVGTVPHFPATDHPFATWYQTLMRGLGAIDINDD